MTRVEVLSPFGLHSLPWSFIFLKLLALLGYLAVATTQRHTSSLHFSLLRAHFGSLQDLLGILPVAFHRAPEGYPSLAMFYTLQITNGWLHRNARMNMVTRHAFSPSSNVLIHRSGEIMYISALGKGVLVINSQRAAMDLLEKRSNTSSDRPHFITVGDFMTKNLSFALTPYGDLCVSCILSHISIHPL